MLKHCSGSSLDLRGRITPEHSRLENGRYRKLQMLNKLDNQRLSVSLLYLDKDQTELMDDRKCSKSISLSSKYGQTRSRKHSISISDSLYTPSCRGVESIRVYARCLRSDIEYRTVRITSSTTANLLIQGLLTKFKLKHVDPKLFYLTMEVTIEALKYTVIKISEDDKLARLLHCNPWSDSKIILRSKSGGFIKVYDTVIMPDSVYKSIRVSYDTTVGEVIGIVLGCCNSDLRPEEFCLLETGEKISRLMKFEEKPLLVCKGWGVSYRNKLVIGKIDVEDAEPFDCQDGVVLIDESEISVTDVGEAKVNLEKANTDDQETSDKEFSLGSQESLDSGYWAQLM